MAEIFGIRTNLKKSLKLDRRSMLKGTAVIGAGLAMAGVGASGVQAAPKRGGKLTMGNSRGATTDSLDPATYLDVSTYMVGWALGNNLVELSPTKEPLPELAESWEGSDDAKKWVFNLRKGVEFHNGKTMTSADVVYSLNRHRGEASESPAKGFLSGVTDIRADGPNTVIIEHGTGDADIPIIMGDFHLQIIPEGFNDFSGLIATGGYVLEQWEPGVRMRAKRNPNYWKEGSAWVDEAEILYVADPAARANALVTGEIDGMNDVEPKTANLMKRNASINIVQSTGGLFRNYEMDTTADAFTNAHIREAVKYATDRQAIVDKVFSGFAEVGNDHPIPENDPFFNTDLPQRPFDLDKAKFHLKQAGVDSIDLELNAADTAFPGAVDAAVLMQEAASGSGVNFNVKRAPSDGYWSAIWNVVPFCMSGWATRPTPGMMFSLAFSSGAPWNSAKWKNDKFDQLLVAGQTETDFEKRKAIYWEMQEICSNDGGFGIFSFPATLDAYSDKIGGAVPDAVMTNSGARSFERLWKI